MSHESDLPKDEHAHTISHYNLEYGVTGAQNAW